MKRLFLVLLFAAPLARAQGWTADSASVSFRIRNAGIAVKGTFDSVQVRLERIGTSWEEAKLSGQVLAGSIDTGLGLRDKHLRKADYFGVEAYPRIRMESGSLRKTRKGLLEGTFSLTMKGQTREIPLTFTCEESKGKISLQTSFELDRREFGIGGNSLILSDRVRVFVSAAFTMESEP